MNRLLVVALMLVTGCGVGAADITVGDEDTLQTDEARLAGDKADHGCHLVLRSVARAPGTGGFATRCTTNGPCYFVWEGVLDVALAAKAAGAKPYVLFRSIDATVWSKKLATAIAGGPAGYQRYKFRLDTNTVNAGMSSTSLQRSKLELSPYLLQADGTRLFDHNRLPGDFDVYALTASNSWSTAEDAAICRPVGQNRSTIQFLNAGWSTVQHGALVNNGKAVIDYDLSRLSACRGTHNGYPAFDITAVVRFSNGTQVEQSVRTFDSPGGIPNFSTLRSQPFEFTIPNGVTSLETWFVNTGLWCSPSYDSNNGSNYKFAIVAPPPKVQWFGNTKSSTSRACVADQNVPSTITLDGYIRERACSFVEGEVYVPGVTDAATQHPELLLARAEATLDGVALPAVWMSFEGRTGNNYRFRYQLPRDTLWYGSKWTTLKYTLSYSTDGVSWSKDVERFVTRDVTWCNPSWSSCAL